MTDLLSSIEQIEILFRCLNQKEIGQDLQGYGLQEWHGLLEQAKIQRLAPLVYKRVINKSGNDRLPGEVVMNFRDSYLSCLVRNLMVYNELCKVLNQFNRNGIPTILLKGSYLAKFIYQDIGLRAMTDVDLMVDRSNLARATAILRELDFSGQDLPLNPKELEVYKHGSILKKPGKINIELHWTIADKDRGLTINEKDLWRCAEPLRIASSECLALSPEDLILHIVIHAIYSDRLIRHARSIVDLAEIINKESDRIHWEILFEKATQWQAERGLYILLYMARHYLNAPVPEDILAGTQPVDFIPSIAADIMCLFSQKEPGLSDRASQVMNSSLLGKGYALLKAAFPSRVSVGRIYHLEVDSWKVWIYYPRLWRDKVRHQKGYAKRLLSGKDDTSRRLNALYQVETWLQIPGFRHRS